MKTTTIRSRNSLRLSFGLKLVGETLSVMCCNGAVLKFNRADAIRYIRQLLSWDRSGYGVIASDIWGDTWGLYWSKVDGECGHIIFRGQVFTTPQFQRLLRWLEAGKKKVKR